jgi:hypothetical protein
VSPTPSSEDRSRSSLRNIVFFRILDGGWVFNPVILGVIHHCQNLLESISNMTGAEYSTQ